MRIDELIELAESTKEEAPKLPSKKYRATAYVDRCMTVVYDGVDNDNWDIIAQFIAENLSGGYTIVVTDNTTSETKTLYPENLITGGT